MLQEIEELENEMQEYYAVSKTKHSFCFICDGDDDGGGVTWDEA